MRILLAPGSAESQKFKRWSLDNFITLAECLRARSFQTDFVLGREELELLEHLSMFNVHAGLGFQDLHELAATSDLAVCNDSFLLHFFSLSDVKTLALYGPTDPSRTLPPNAALIHSEVDLACRPCWGTEAYGKCPIAYSCLSSLEVNEVFNRCLVLVNDE